MPQRFNLSTHVFAHRGLWGGDVPENSLKAFQLAAQSGFGAECDVHLSADGIPMVFHDFDLKRLTGKAGQVKEADYAKLQGFTLNRSDQSIPTLQAVLKTMGDLPLLVELKSNLSTDRALLADTVTRLTDRHPGPLAIMSFDLKLMDMVSRLTNGPLLGFLLDLAQPCTIDLLRTQIGNTPIDFLGPGVQQLSQVGQVAREMKIDLACWTVRSIDEFKAVREQNGAPIFENLETPLVRSLFKP